MDELCRWKWCFKRTDTHFPPAHDRPGGLTMICEGESLHPRPPSALCLPIPELLLSAISVSLTGPRCAAALCHFVMPRSERPETGRPQRRAERVRGRLTPRHPTVTGAKAPPDPAPPSRRVSSSELNRDRGGRRVEARSVHGMNNTFWTMNELKDSLTGFMF